MVTNDIKFLYTSIPSAEGTKEVKVSFEKDTSKNVATKVIKFWGLTLTLNGFVFNYNTYLQIKDCAMGTIWAASYANIFMDHFEKYIYPILQGVS